MIATAQSAAPVLVFDHGNGVACWLMDGEYFVYGITSDPRVAHSEGAARSIAAGAVA